MDTTKTHLRIHVRECEVPPPGFYPGDELNPTPEEIARHAEQCRIWEAHGGLDQHYFRADLTIGPEKSWEDKSLVGLKRLVIQSPIFHKDHHAIREEAREELRRFVGRAIEKQISTYPL